MHLKYALRFGTAAAATLLLTAPAGSASAATTAVIEAIDYQRHDDAVLVHYHLSSDYDPADVRVGRSGKVVRIVLPGARLRGSKKQWPRPEDKFVKGSFAYQLTPTTMRHKLRLATAVSRDDITVRRFGDVVVARIPKRAGGAAVAMAPADDPDAARASAPPSPSEDPPALTAAAAGPAAAAADRRDEAEDDAEDAEGEAPKTPADASRQRLMRELFASPDSALGGDPDVAIASTVAQPRPDAPPAALAQLGADLPDINPVTWLLIMAALALMLFAARRKARFAGLSRASEGRTITVLDRKTVAGKTGVALLEAAGRLVLVGTSDTGLTALADLGPSDDDFQSVVARSVDSDPALPASAILPSDLTPATSAGTSATAEHRPPAAAHAAGAPALAAVDAFRAKVAALRSA